MWHILLCRYQKRFSPVWLKPIVSLSPSDLSGHSNDREQKQERELKDLWTIINVPTLGLHFHSSIWKTKSSSGKELISSDHHYPQHLKWSGRHGCSPASFTHFPWNDKVILWWLLMWAYSHKRCPFLKTLKIPLPFHILHLTFHFLINIFIILIIQNFSPSKHLSFILNTLTFSALSQPSLQMGFHASEWTLRTPPAPASLPWPPASFRAPLFMQPFFCLPIQSHAHSFPSFLLHFHTMLFVTLSYVLASDLSTASKPHFPLGCLLPLQILTDHMCIWTWTSRSVRLNLMIQKHNLDIKYSTCVMRRMTYHKGNKAPQFLTPFPISFSK